MSDDCSAWTWVDCVRLGGIQMFKNKNEEEQPVVLTGQRGRVTQ